MTGQLKALLEHARTQRFLAATMVGYLRFAVRSSKLVLDPPDVYERLRAHYPFILAMWHGEHIAVPLVKDPTWVIKAMVSRSNDGELSKMALEAMGIQAIRASGGRATKAGSNRGSVSGTLAAIRELKAGNIFAMTADVPRGTPKQAGIGIATIAKISGRPVIPFAVAATRSLRLNSWDSAPIILPFGRFAFTVGDPITIARNADDAALEAGRLAIERELNRTTDRAYALAGGKRG
jgi:lysophospholipid acyltransferase (LPLAT)-like uncharacterized protein